MVRKFIVFIVLMSIAVGGALYAKQKYAEKLTRNVHDMVASYFQDRNDKMLQASVAYSDLQVQVGSPLLGWHGWSVDVSVSFDAVVKLRDKPAKSYRSSTKHITLSGDYALRANDIGQVEVALSDPLIIAGVDSLGNQVSEVLVGEGDVSGVFDVKGGSLQVKGDPFVFKVTDNSKGGSHPVHLVLEFHGMDYRVSSLNAGNSVIPSISFSAKDTVFKYGESESPVLKLASLSASLSETPSEDVRDRSKINAAIDVQGYGASIALAGYVMKDVMPKNHKMQIFYADADVTIKKYKNLLKAFDAATGASSLSGSSGRSSQVEHRMITALLHKFFTRQSDGSWTSRVRFNRNEPSNRRLLVNNIPVRGGK